MKAVAGVGLSHLDIVNSFDFDSDCGGFVCTYFDCELRRVSCLPTRLVCLPLLFPVYSLCQLSTILSCF